MFSLTGAKIRGTLSKKKASPSLRVGKTLNVRDGGGAATLRSNQGEKPLTGREGERNHVRNFYIEICRVARRIPILILHAFTTNN